MSLLLKTRMRANLSRMHHEAIKDRIFFVTRTRGQSPEVRALLKQWLIEVSRQPTVEQKTAYLREIHDALKAEQERRRSIAAQDLLRHVERFLSGLTRTDQDDVLEQLEPWRYKLTWALREYADSDRQAYADLRFLACRLELEALLQHPEVLIDTARILHTQVMEHAPQFPS